MEQRHTQQGRFTEHGHGIGTVTEDMVRRRAHELAEAAGRPPGQVLDSDLDEARRELTGQSGLTPDPTPAEQLPEDKRWDPVAETPEQRAPTVPAADEQTFAERLIEEGVEDAELEQMDEAEREAREKDKAEGEE
jgi:hypothetical protein